MMCQARPPREFPHEELRGRDAGRRAMGPRENRHPRPGPRELLGKHATDLGQADPSRARSGESSGISANVRGIES